MGLLEPFRFDGPEEAAQANLSGNPPYPGDQVFGWLSRFEAKGYVIQLAVDFNRWSAIERDAPRVKETIQQLHDVEEQAGNLARMLASLDDYTRAALQTGGTLLDLPAGRADPRAGKLSDEAGIRYLPLPGNEGSKDGPDQGWVAILEMLSRYAGRTAATYAEQFGSGDIDTPDRGGRTTPYKRLHGSAKWRLVGGAWHLFEWCRPGEGMATDGGRFHRFVAALYAVATGQSADDGSGLDRLVKRFAGLQKQAVALRQRTCELEALLETMPWPIEQPTSDKDNSPGAAKWRVRKELADLEIESQRYFDLYRSDLRPASPKGQNPPR